MAGVPHEYAMERIMLGELYARDCPKESDANAKRESERTFLTANGLTVDEYTLCQIAVATKLDRMKLQLDLGPSAI